MPSLYQNIRTIRLPKNQTSLASRALLCTVLYAIRLPLTIFGRGPTESRVHLIASNRREAVPFSPLTVAIRLFRFSPGARLEFS